MTTLVQRKATKRQNVNQKSPTNFNFWAHPTFWILEIVDKLVMCGRGG